MTISDISLLLEMVVAAPLAISVVFLVLEIIYSACFRDAITIIKKKLDAQKF